MISNFLRFYAVSPIKIKATTEHSDFSHLLYSFIIAKFSLAPVVCEPIILKGRTLGVVKCANKLTEPVLLLLR